MNINPMCNRMLINVLQEDYTEEFHVSAALVIQLDLITSPLAIMDDVLANKKKGNKASQYISQSQASVQNSQVVYGGDTYDKTFVVLHVYPR